MKKIIIIITCFIGLSGAFAQQREIFHNPVIEADVPDPSMIRVGNYYYLVSTTMHLMPGCPVMRSKDLVHWETISYVFQRLTDLPRYDLKEGTVYGRGQWASSIRYHDGRFYVWFSPNDEPHRGYIYTAEDPAGEWTLVSRPPHHHDASLFFDDDGKVYLFYGTGQLRQLKSDLSDVEPGGIDQKIFERDADEQGLLEESQAFKLHEKAHVENAYVSAFSTLSYSLLNRYTLGGSIRFDGSDLFGVDKKYRYLPLYSVSGLWRISQEPFMASAKWIDNLVVRASYGLQGNIDKNTFPFGKLQN